MIISLAPTLLRLQIAVTPGRPTSGIQDAAYGPDGRLALAVDGDIWVQRSKRDSTDWIQVTSGPAWDREPAWSSDGSSLVIASDRDGSSRLYRANSTRSDLARRKLARSAVCVVQDLTPFPI